MEPALYYLLGGDGRPYGPARAETVRQWLREGRIQAPSPANRVGTPDWQPLSQFPEFADVLPPPPLPTAPPVFPAVGPRRTHPLAVAGFLCGLVSLSCCACCGGELLAILALVLSTLALVEINRQPDRYDGRSLAIAGLVLGGIGAALGLLGAGASLAASFADGVKAHRSPWR